MLINAMEINLFHVDKYDAIKALRHLADAMERSAGQVISEHEVRHPPCHMAVSYSTTDRNGDTRSELLTPHFKGI